MKLGLGTAQFGMDYGITNARGRTSPDEVRAILDVAREAGISLLDTASAYGECEAVLGAAMSADEDFRIVTKLPAQRDGDPDPVSSARAAFDRSLANLRRESVYGLLVHAASALLEPTGDQLWELLVRLKADGRVERIGVSLYADECEATIARYPVELVQAPLSLLDQRLLANGQLAELKRRGVEVHVRSVLLQGVIALDPAALPSGLDGLREPMTALRRGVAREGLSVLEAAIGFAYDRPEVDGVLVGVTTADELRQIIDAAERPDLRDAHRYAVRDERLIDPRRWPNGARSSGP